MKHTAPHHARPPGRSRRRRASRQLGSFDALSERETAAAMDDAATAEQLMNDLVALIDAGLVVSIEVDGQTHFAAAPVDAEDADP